jgi:hypothetical protein
MAFDWREAWIGIVVALGAGAGLAAATGYFIVGPATAGWLPLGLGLMSVAAAGYFFRKGRRPE